MGGARAGERTAGGNAEKDHAPQAGEGATAVKRAGGQHFPRPSAL